MIVKHPGLIIKKELPTDLSVKDAAELLGVGRPALSNFLNGKARLSDQMAQRLSNTFGFPLEQLFQWRTEYEESLVQNTHTPITHVYAPPFLDIKANDIENWVNTDEISSRARLAVFLRILIHSTCKKIAKIDFPGNDDSQRPGWDGWLESSESTPWVPEGLSGWEFGVNKDIKSKANKDFEKSTKAHIKDTSNITFIFVTPHRWSQKNEWVKEKKALEKWKDVRAYDSSDLEQWLAQSLPAQSWLANEAKLSTQSVNSLESIWKEWAEVCTPSLIPAFFTKLIESHKEKVVTYLSQKPQRPFYIAADSQIEGIAFLYALFNSDESLAIYRDNSLVFKEEYIFPRLAEGTKNFIAITENKKVEKELAPYSQKIHSFVIYPKNTLTHNIDITLEILDTTTFIKALEEMGNPYDKASVIAKKSGYSLSVLRRQISEINAIKVPGWVEKSNRELIPFLFAGIWDSNNKNDCSILEQLSDNLLYEHLEKVLQANLVLNDSPVWSVDSHRGVVSKIDLLFAIANYITKSDIERYFDVAKKILEEDDPALDLPDDQQWCANIYNKKRLYSKNLRDSIGEMLILLAVHGNELFQTRLGFDCISAVDNFIRDLFFPLTLRKLQANSSNLSTYAEASPSVFLEIISNDLNSNKFILDLMQPVKNSFLESPKYTDLLWALEKLAWNKSTVASVVTILAQLSQKEINDNYSNKPSRSLFGIFRSWLPATNININERILLLKKLVKEYPEVGWDICIGQFPDSFPQMAIHASKCIWRRDFVEQISITNQDIYDFCMAAISIALEWPSYSLTKLLDLVSHIHGLNKEQQNRVWLLIKDWALNLATETEKIEMREKLRTTVLSRRAKKRSNYITLTKLGKEAYAALEPKELIDKYYWLFRAHWVDESADEIENVTEMDFSEREEFIRLKRINALKEIFKEKGYQGILELCSKGDCATTIGFLLRRFIFSSNKNIIDQIKLALISLTEKTNASYQNLIRGIMFESNDNKSLFEELLPHLSDHDKVKVYLQSPFESLVWEQVNYLDTQYQKEYWDNINPTYCRNLDEVSESVKNLLSANRPQTAFAYISLELNDISPEIIFNVLSAMLLPTAKNENSPPDGYHLGKAFSRISDSRILSLEEKAGLEYAYISVLAPYGRKSENCSIQNLELYIEKHPEFFVQIISELYKRDDGSDDENSENIETQEKKEQLFKQLYYTLEALRRLPGENSQEEIDINLLQKWVDTAIILAEKSGRKNITEYFIGKLLSQCKKGKDNIWPCEEIRELVENYHSPKMIDGMYIGLRNSRGVTSRSLEDGGNQEREIVELYKNWSEQLAITHPFVARTLLTRLSEAYQNEAQYWDNQHRLEMHLR